MEEKKVNPKDYEVGAVVGRFQLADFHEAHKFLIDTAVNNHKKVIILLGVPKAIGTPEDPIRLPSRENVLDFTSRQYMVQETYPNAIVVPIQDKDGDHIWSESVDAKIREVFPTEKVLLYGGRDSFIPHYHGVFDTLGVDPDIYVSATEVRSSISKEALKSVDFRKGQIYNAYQQSPMLYTNYKIGLIENGKILFHKQESYQHKDDKLKLLSGLAGINDPSYEIGAKRVIGNLIGSLETSTKYELSNSKIEFGNKSNRVMNVLISARKMFGQISPKAGYTVQWISIESLLSEDFITKNIDENDIVFINHLIEKYKDFE